MGERLRQILEESEGRYVSGQDIARTLGMSRAAVWKRIRAMRLKGFGIEGAPGAGYRLVEGPDVLEEADVASRLTRRPFWSSFVFLPVTDSTNRYAAEAAAKGSPHGTVVCADEQTRGRGRLGRSWASPRGVNLYLSLLLRPPIEPRFAPRLTLATAVALARAVERIANLPAGLKWPNDLYLGNRKAAGILAEMSADPDLLRHVVIGVGLNVNAERGDFPEPLRETATSLKLSSGGRRFSRAAVLAGFLDEFAEVYETFLSGGFAALLPDWRKRSFLDGKRVTVRVNDEDAEGTVLGVDEEGALLFRRLGGRRTERLQSGEISKFPR
jgi:BirA family biotin operon repressor/biotin-[acetyl-CoA-carboxylase] ligase